MSSEPSSAPRARAISGALAVALFAIGFAIGAVLSGAAGFILKPAIIWTFTSSTACSVPRACSAIAST